MTAFRVSTAEYNVCVPTFRGNVLPFCNCPLEVQQTFCKNNMSATCVEFEMRRLPLRGEKKYVQIPPGLNSNVHLNMLTVHESNMAILKLIFRNRRLSNVTRRPGFSVMFYLAVSSRVKNFANVRSALFRDFTQHIVTVYCRRFGTSVPIFKGQEVP
jgi:hypothetical protein